MSGSCARCSYCARRSSRNFIEDACGHSARMPERPDRGFRRGGRGIDSSVRDRTARGWRVSPAPASRKMDTPRAVAPVTIAQRRIFAITPASVSPSDCSCGAAAFADVARRGWVTAELCSPVQRKPASLQAAATAREAESAPDNLTCGAHVLDRAPATVSPGNPSRQGRMPAPSYSLQALSTRRSERDGLATPPSGNRAGAPFWRSFFDRTARRGSCGSLDR